MKNRMTYKVGASAGTFKVLDLGQKDLEIRSGGNRYGNVTGRTMGCLKG
jgi:hypothetical protein